MWSIGCYCFIYYMSALKQDLMFHFNEQFAFPRTYPLEGQG